jgi:hypothetical protein
MITHAAIFACWANYSNDELIYYLNIIELKEVATFTDRV